MNELIEINEKHALFLRIFHWMNVLFLSLMIWSGVLIYWANPVYLPVPDKIGPFVIHHRLAEGMGWHFLTMWFFALNGFCYVLLLLVTKRWKEIFPMKETFRDFFPYLLFDLKIKKNSPRFSGIFNPVQRLAYFFTLLMGIGSLLTGLAIYKPVQVGILTFLLGGYEAAHWEHFLLMNGFCGFIVVHVIQVIRAGWNNLRSMIAGFEVVNENQ